MIKYSQLFSSLGLPDQEVYTFHNISTMPGPDILYLTPSITTSIDVMAEWPKHNSEMSISGYNRVNVTTRTGTLEKTTTIIEGNYLTTYVGMDETVSNYADIANKLIIKGWSSSISTLGEPIYLYFAVAKPEADLFASNYNVDTAILTTPDSTTITGTYISGSLSAPLAQSSYKLWQFIIPPEKVSILNVDGNGDPILEWGLYSISLVGSSAFTSMNIKQGILDIAKDYGSDVVFNLEFKADLPQHASLWQKRTPDLSVRTLTYGTVPSSTLALGTVAASVTRANTVTNEVIFRNTSFTNVVLTKFIATLNTPSYATLSATAKAAVANDFGIAVETGTDANGVTYSAQVMNLATPFTYALAVTLPFMGTRSLKITYAPALKVLPIAANFTPYNAATAPALANAVNANRKVKIQMYGYLETDLTMTEVAIGDPLYVTGLAT